MLPGMELMGCPELAVPAGVMHHVVSVESSFNPYAIGVVGGRLARQPANLPEAVATARMLESRGYNFSLGLAQVNRYNLVRYGLASYEQAFQACPNLRAGSRILAECHQRAGRDWGKSFSCYYSGNFVTGFREGYVQKIYASMSRAAPTFRGAIPVYGAPPRPSRRGVQRATSAASARAGPIARDTAQLAAAGRAPKAADARAPASPFVASDAPVLLQPQGRAPRLVDRQADVTSPSPGADTRDTAFVF